MNATGPETLQRNEVLPRRVAAVSLKTVSRISLGEPLHVGVALNLGENRGGGDRLAVLVSGDDVVLGDAQAGNGARVHEDVLRNYQWEAIPVLFFIALILAFVFVGDGLRDAADPYSKSKK